MTSNNFQKPYEIALCGVGGQGVLTMTDILCDAAVVNGFTVRGSETHGMAQRGGSILTHIRIADASSQVFAPLIRDRSADVLVATEPVEALRQARIVSGNGIILVNLHGVPPPSLTYSREKYPENEDIIAALHEFCSNIKSIDATGLAEFAGSPASLNVVMLGALSKVEGFPISFKTVGAQVHTRFRERFREVNQRAFEAGYDA
ncbi:MAG: indolepyruvate oxidoreductase subunit beta [Candidatus Heimdallarchaeota archaeon]